MEETEDLVQVKESGVISISQEGANAILQLAIREGIRGASTKNSRIRKKIMKKRLMKLVADYIKEN